jgi:hypothetical protein
MWRPAFFLIRKFWLSKIPSTIPDRERDFDFFLAPFFAVQARSRALPHGVFQMSEVQDWTLPPELERERVLLMPEIERITSLSHDTITKYYADKLVRVSPRRIGMKLKDVLAIATPRNPV